MPRGPRGEYRPSDVVGCAVRVGRIATGEVEDIEEEELDGDGYAAYALPEKEEKEEKKGVKKERKNDTNPRQIDVYVVYSGMNKLPLHKRKMVLNMLVEGSSMWSISRVADVSFNTVNKLLVDAGRACAEYHDRVVRDVTVRRVQCDEIWSFCYAKAKNVEEAKAAPEGAGDVWTWTALDSDSKMILAYAVGDRSLVTATVFK